VTIKITPEMFADIPLPIPTTEQRLRALILKMGHIIRSMDVGGDFIEYWTNDGNEHGPDYNVAHEDIGGAQ